jgi:NitT/TauT family transport system substrate-binding protein
MPLKVRYAYAAIAGSMAPIWIATDLGLFAANGIEPELSYAPSTQTVQAVLSGDVDFGMMSVRTLVEAHVAGADAVGVAITTNKVVQSLYAAPGIATVADLRDRRVGITRFGSIVANSARMLLKPGGLTPPDDVVLLQLNGFPEIMAAPQGGATEAGILSPPFTLAVRKAGYRELARMQDLPFEYANVVLVGRRSYVAANADATRRTVRAMAEATAIFRDQRETSLPVLAAYLKTDDAEVLAETY